MNQDVLRHAPLFSELDDESMTALFAMMGRTRLKRGEVLFREGDAADRLYAVVDGKVKLSRASADGQDSVLAILGSGQVFGELSLFDPGQRSSTVTAVADEVQLASLSHDDLLALLDGRPSVTRGLLALLSGRLRRANDVIGDLVFADVPRRVAKALLNLADRFGESTDEGMYVRHDLTQEELAQLVGAARETVNKALADFVAKGWVKLESRAVIITDMERIVRRAG
ncbi:MAG: Crp/Fnr family transcriptional regulator [Nocardioides sp.]|uniref:Crp/Fnr family transcriptional regulator n=1 Tax=Nocardioides sp. TaxID=35761 RepID=UPI003D6B7ECC